MRASQSFIPTAKRTVSGSPSFADMDIVIWMYGHGYVVFSNLKSAEADLARPRQQKGRETARMSNGSSGLKAKSRCTYIYTLFFACATPISAGGVFICVLRCTCRQHPPPCTSPGIEWLSPGRSCASRVWIGRPIDQRPLDIASSGYTCVKTRSARRTTKTPCRHHAPTVCVWS
jgi:hypothetical protein